MYKVSVAIPIYNVENYIEECLESVLIQLPYMGTSKVSTPRMDG